MRQGQLPGPTELTIRTSGPVPARLSSVRTPQRRPTRTRDARCPFRKRHCRPNRGRGTRISSRWSLPPVWPMLVGASSPRIPDARRGEPQTLCREAFSFRSLADLHESDTNLTPTAARTNPKREDGQRLRWSSAWWSPPPESNRRPHPYHEPPGTAVRTAIPPGHPRP